MNKTTSLILLALFSLIWLFFSTRYYNNTCCGIAADATPAPAVLPMGENTYCGPWNVFDGSDFDQTTAGYLQFLRGESEVLGYGEETESLLTNLADYLTTYTNRSLVVTGIYNQESETYSGEQADLGIARAESVKAILTGLGVADEQITVESGFSEGSEFYGDTLCHGAEFAFGGEPNEAAVEEVTSESVCADLEAEGLILYFAFSSDNTNFTEEERRYLDALVECLNSRPKARIQVDGHTDNVGGDSNNQILSRARARKIRTYLTANGISKRRISIEGYGDTRPVESNDTDEGRAKNRRVEVKLK